MEILNSYVWVGGRRISNGPIEGKNNYLKKIINNTNGLKNFQRAEIGLSFLKIYMRNIH
nr:hypothetical protein [Breznakia pachnodae]